MPDRPEWLHEVKHDGYRLIVQRDSERVRLFTRNGHDWSGRYPRISEAALRNRNTSFVIDGEAVLLGRSGIAACEADADKMNKPLTIFLIDRDVSVVSWLITTVEIVLR